MQVNGPITQPWKEESEQTGVNLMVVKVTACGGKNYEHDIPVGLTGDNKSSPFLVKLYVD